MSPLLYEINTRCWLRELSERTGKTVQLGTVPEDELARWRRLGFTHVWLMGVWKTGPRARQRARHHWRRQQAHQPFLAEYRAEDIAGSPYAIADFQVADDLGGAPGLKRFRERLRQHGLGLFLDFVPNHLGLDHPWISSRPELFVQSKTKRAETVLIQTSAGRRWLAHGKDPYFPAWTDTAQLDYRRPETRQAMIEIMQSIAKRCDGARCDMAMLVLNDVFAKTWRDFPCPAPPLASEFWDQAIAAARIDHPRFLFLAEAYWDLELRLQQSGFDYTYDKRLYDHLLRRKPAQTQQHLLSATPEFVRASAHFLENHDEPRIASLLSFAEHRAAALLTLSLPGLRILHDGQLTGRRRFAMIQMGRRLPEPLQPEIAALYEELLVKLQGTAVGRGHSQILKPTPAWADNPTAQDFVVVLWQSTRPEFDLVIVNLADHPSQCYVRLPVEGLAGHDWELVNLLGPEAFQRGGSDLERQGLYLDVPGHGAQLFHLNYCAPHTI